MGAKAGSTAAVAALLDAGADINWSDDMERTALGEAAIEGHLPVVKLLLRELGGGGWAEIYQPQCMNDHRSELAMEGCLWLKWRALFCLASSAGCGFRLRMRCMQAASGSDAGARLPPRVRLQALACCRLGPAQAAAPTFVIGTARDGRRYTAPAGKWLCLGCAAFGSSLESHFKLPVLPFLHARICLLPASSASSHMACIACCPAPHLST